MITLKTCPDCGVKYRTRRRRCDACANAMHEQKANAYKARVRAERTAKGLCIKCGKHKRAEGLTVCKSCNERDRERNTNIRNERVAKGLCIKCGDLLPKRHFYKTCEACREWACKKDKMNRERKKNEQLSETSGQI